jgi:hypothetical protein
MRIIKFAVAKALGLLHRNKIRRMLYDGDLHVALPVLSVRYRGCSTRIKTISPHCFIVSKFHNLGNDVVMSYRIIVSFLMAKKHRYRQAGKMIACDKLKSYMRSVLKLSPIFSSTNMQKKQWK